MAARPGGVAAKLAGLYVVPSHVTVTCVCATGPPSPGGSLPEGRMSCPRGAPWRSERAEADRVVRRLERGRSPGGRVAGRRRRPERAIWQQDAADGGGRRARRVLRRPARG